MDLELLLLCHQLSLAMDDEEASLEELLAHRQFLRDYKGPARLNCREAGAGAGSPGLVAIASKRATARA